jgi:hypothetical protein
MFFPGAGMLGIFQGRTDICSITADDVTKESRRDLYRVLLLATINDEDDDNDMQRRREILFWL